MQRGQGPLQCRSVPVRAERRSAAARPYHALVPMNLAADVQLRSEVVSANRRHVGHSHYSRAASDAPLHQPLDQKTKGQLSLALYTRGWRNPVHVARPADIRVFSSQCDNLQFEFLDAVCNGSQALSLSSRGALTWDKKRNPAQPRQPARTPAAAAAAVPARCPLSP